MELYTVYRILVRIRRLKWLWWSLALLPVLGFVGYKGFLFIDKELFVSEELPIYDIGPHPNDDTLRVAVIGDSWAEYHTSLECDTIFCRYAKRLTSLPVKSFSRGHSGKTTKEVYYEMFSDRTVEHVWDVDRCTQPLMEQHPDYCIIMAGINDWRLFKSCHFYVENYRLMLNLLIKNGIRPVVMEMPNVDMIYFHGKRKIYRKWMFKTLSLLTGIDESYESAQDYRDAMKEMLQEYGLEDKVLFIPMSAWNPGGIEAAPEIYLDDRLHINMDGYHILDSCMAYEVIKDFQKRNKLKAK